RKRMDAELLLLATTDFLTGLPNRREFMARLDDELARLQRSVDESAAVLMLDIDHFKTVNDEFGHATGDAVLRHMAGLMRAGQRKIDTLGRVGGEEFAVLLPGASLEAAAAYAERLRQSVAETPLVNEGREIAITVSIGIASIRPQDASADAALIRADRALYNAKDAGRNRVGQLLASQLV
ncbi:MAG TPA: GGDEF domain-containing protein, partial [Telluria sp.]|nr:GGDEF domain-containing protein [Telluria sp.]